MIRAAFIPALLLTVAGCVPESNKGLAHSYVPYKLKPSDIPLVQSGVRKGLKDPGSAQFGEVYKASVDEQGTVYVCGFANAKNSYGGYVGMQPFQGLFMTAGPAKNFSVVSMGGTEIDTNVTMTMCRDEGIAL